MTRCEKKLSVGVSVLALLCAVSISSGADVTANLGGGTYIYQTFSGEGAGPDTLRVTATRSVKSTYAASFPNDVAQITPTWNQGTNIIAANAVGRGAGVEVLYAVEGVFVGGGGGGGGTTVTWEADYDTNLDAHFIVYINERYRSDDDGFTLTETSRVTVELHNATSVQGPVYFKLSQTPLEDGGAVVFEPDQAYVISPGEPVTVNAKGSHVGVVSIIARQTDSNGDPLVDPEVENGTASGPVMDTVWLITHNPKWEKEFAQTRSYCKQAELMSNKMYVTCESNEEALTAKLYQDVFGSDPFICNGRLHSHEGTVWTFVFDPSKESTTPGYHKTDTDGAIYIEGTKLTEPSASSPSPRNFYVEIKSGGDLVKRQDMKIGPAIEFLQFNKTDLMDLKTFDPYTDKYAYGLFGGGFGLQIDYNYYTWFSFLPDCGDGIGIVQFENAIAAEIPTVGGQPLGRPGVMTPAGAKAYLVPNSDELLYYSWLSHAIKWEGFDNTFLGEFNQHEDAQQTFMGSNPLPSAASPDNLVGEGCYKLTFGIKLKADTTQKHRFSVVFGVKYKKDSGPDDRGF